MKDIDDTELEDSQLAVRVPKHLKDFFALYSKREGETQQDLVIRWLSKLKQDHARGNPVAAGSGFISEGEALRDGL